MTGNRNFTILDAVTTATGDSGAIKATSDKIALAFDFTDVSGAAASIAIKVDWSPDGVNFGPAATPDVFPAVTVASVVVLSLDVKGAYYKVTWTLTGDIAEIQAVEHNHTGGTFTLSFSGQGPTGLLDWDAPNDSVAAAGTLTMDIKPTALTASQGTLTMDTNPSAGVAAQGTLTIVEPVTDADTFTLDAKVYTLQTALTDVDGNIAIGANEAATKLNIVAAINRTGTPGTDYAGAMTIHPTISAAAFSVDACVLTAKTKGTAGNALVSTETFTDVGNVFDAATLGTTTAGVQPDTVTVDARVYTWQDVLTNVDGNILIGATVAASQANFVAAINRELGYGSVYADATTLHATVSIGDFAANAAILTAKTGGTGGDSIATTETFATGTNIFDAATLGTTVAGLAADTVTIGASTYTFVDVDAGLSDEVFIGASLATAQAALVVAVASNASATLAAFAADAAIATAIVAGTAGNAVVSTETFAGGTNVWDATTLGTTTLGVNGLQTELELFSNITSLTVVRNAAGDWDVTFPSSDGNVAEMTIDGALLTGGSTATVTTAPGGVDAVFTAKAVATHFDRR